MNRRIDASRLAALLLLTGLAGCGIFSEKRSGPAQAGDLVGSIERVYVESEVSKDKILEAIATLEAIASSEFRRDAVAAHAALLQAIEHSEKQAKKLRENVEPMKDAAGPFFKQWSSDLDAFASKELRNRSEARLEATRERYAAVVAAVDPMQAAYDEFNKGLRDHALFLSHDFNPAAIAAIQGDVERLSSQAKELDAKLGACLDAARAYVDASALAIGSDKTPEARKTEHRPRVEPVRGARSED